MRPRGVVVLSPRSDRRAGLPLLTVQIDALTDQLLAKLIAKDDLTILTEAGEHGRLTVGRIMLVARSSGRTTWFWTVTGRAQPGTGIELVAEAESLEAAKLDFRRAFDAVLYWCAIRRDGEIPWHAPAMP